MEKVDMVESQQSIREKALERIAKEQEAFSDDHQEQKESPPKASQQSNYFLECADSGEIGDARVFIELYRGQYSYDHASGRWYQYREHFWIEDCLCNVVAALDKVIEVYGQEADRWEWLKEKAKKNKKEKEEIEAGKNEAIFRSKITLLQKKTYRLNVLFYLLQVITRLV